MSNHASPCDARAQHTKRRPPTMCASPTGASKAAHFLAVVAPPLPTGATGRSTTTLLIISPFKIRTAVLALPMVRPHNGQVCTKCGCITLVSFFLDSSVTPKLMSSRTTQPLTSRSCSWSHVEISLALLSANCFTRSPPFSKSKFIGVLSVQGRMRSLPNLSDSALHNASLLRHSDESTIFADVRSTMCRRALTAEGKKSDVSTLFNESASAVEMSKPPARAGRSTPSTSKKSTLLLSTG
mmetsp:Transcript_95991/g.275566  ORF Transcript_95991/g.275566 Transcript_95991/m.275566 type:complete len:240 (+) Transcript_95991:56-775(+)